MSYSTLNLASTALTHIICQNAWHSRCLINSYGLLGELLYKCKRGTHPLEETVKVKATLMLNETAPSWSHWEIRLFTCWVCLMWRIWKM